MATEPQIDPESLVARIIAELQANPDAQRLLLRALLTNEFLGIPAQLDRIEKDIQELKVDVSHLKADVAELKADMVEVKSDVTGLKADMVEVKSDVTGLKADMVEVKSDVTGLKADMVEVKSDVTGLKADMVEVKSGLGTLKGFALESLLHRRVRPLISQVLGLRATRIIQSGTQEPLPELTNAVDVGADNGLISPQQENRVSDTDIILRGLRRGDPTPVWVAIEASNKVDSEDIRRARETADILGSLFEGEFLAVVAGHSIDQSDRQRADATGVMYLEVTERY